MERESASEQSYVIPVRSSEEENMIKEQAARSLISMLYKDTSLLFESSKCKYEVKQKKNSCEGAVFKRLCTI